MTARRSRSGSIRTLASGRHQVRYTDANGRRRSAPHTFATKTEAWNWLDQTRADVLRGTHRTADLGDVPLADFLRSWLDRRTDIRPTTRAGYEHAIDRWIDRDLSLPSARSNRPHRFHLGDRHLNTLTVSDIRDWHAAAHATQVAEADQRAARGQLSRRARAARDRARRRPMHPARAWAYAHGVDVNPRGVVRADVVAAWERAGCPETPDGTLVDRSGTPHAALPPLIVNGVDERPVAPVISQAYRYLRAGLNAAVADGLIQSNPCQLKRAGSTNAVPRVIAEPHEVTALADAMPERLAVAVHLAAWSGLRGGEVFALARRHIDLEAGTVTVERSLKQVNNGPVTFGPPKTDAGRRTVNLPASVTARLAAHLDRFTGAAADALVFTTESGTPLTQAQRSRAFARARSKIGRPDLRFHDLRHTGATLAAREGATLVELQHRLGHTTVQAAMRYQHATAARDRALADRLDLLAAADSNVIAFPVSDSA